MAQKGRNAGPHLRLVSPSLKAVVGGVPSANIHVWVADPRNGSSRKPTGWKNLDVIEKGQTDYRGAEPLSAE
ncbi:hypothetical protein [Dickeya dadantii]|uniref:hypothetical protein n=1 Tax=Dickeya dadantii TaxID=204038 RepID=UPI001C0D38E3|nr:hypothetical protein [Dickeya dadantii]QWT40601.1 hypothetical protein KNV89_20185 [Dickeya dadantii]